MIWVVVPLVFGVGYFSGHRRGYLKALEKHVDDLMGLARQASERGF